MTTNAIRNHERVYETLKAAGAPMSAYDLLAALRDHGFKAPLTVYRALDRLVLEGRVHKLDSLKAYVACSHPGHRAGTAAFAICRDCGRTEEMVQAEAFATLRDESERRGFAAEEASIELKGTCAACRERTARA